MALTLPGIPLAYSPQFSEAPRTRHVSFQDGYSLRSPDGLNTRSTKVTLRWRARPAQDMRELRNFFAVHNGAAWFWWTPTGYSHNEKWICREYSWSPVEDGRGEYWDFDATLEQVHDLA